MKNFAMLGLGLVIWFGSAVQADEKEKPKFDASKLEGKWKMVSGERDGKAVEADHLKGTVTITKDLITIEGDMTHKMSYKLDAKDMPVKIDMEGVEGPAKGFKALGMIELKGDEFKLVYDMMGGERPKAFTAKKDTNVLYIVLKRAK